MADGAPAAAAPGARTIRIIAFNDVYEIEPRAAEPVGGAARFVSLVKSFGPEALVLFAGDAFNPSLLSTITQGKQMVEVLNACGVQAACVGNHDFDFSVEVAQQRFAECSFPWLMANVVDAKSGAPRGGARPSLLLDWQGVRLGLVGLVEQEWLTTLSSVDPQDVRYIDFVEEGERRAAELRAQGAEAVIALTHMRLPNDMRLAQESPGIDLVLGGHDHEYYLLRTDPHGTAVVKSGTDFRDLTEIHLTLSHAQGPSQQQAQPGGGGGGDPAALVAAAQQVAEQVAALPGAVADAFSELAARAHKRCSKWARLAGIPALAGCSLQALPASACEGGDELGPIEPPQSPAGGGAHATPEGRFAAGVYEAVAGASLATSLEASRRSGPSGASGLQLTVRCVRHTVTSDLAEDPAMVEVVQRYAALMGERMDVQVGETATDLDGRFATVRTGESNLGNLVCDIWRQAAGADAALLNGGTLRSDRVHPAGVLTHRDLVSMLPMLDETVLIRVTGAQLLGALEAGVSQWPKHEGRFPQVSGIRFSFDGSREPGKRVVPGSVSVGGEPLQEDRAYSLITKAYLAEGKDGYGALCGAVLLQDSDSTPLLPTVVAQHFLTLRMANAYLENTGRVKPENKVARRLVAHSAAYAGRSQERLAEAGESRAARLNPLTRRWQIAPVCDGRITRVGGDA